MSCRLLGQEFIPLVASVGCNAHIWLLSPSQSFRTSLAVSAREAGQARPFVLPLWLLMVVRGGGGRDISTGLSSTSILETMHSGRLRDVNELLAAYVRAYTCGRAAVR